MSYISNNRVIDHSELGGLWDDITGIAKKAGGAVKTAYDTHVEGKTRTQIAQEQAAAAQAQAAAANQGFFAKHGTTLLLVGAAVGGIYLLTRK